MPTAGDVKAGVQNVFSDNWVAGRRIYLGESCGSVYAGAGVGLAGDDRYPGVSQLEQVFGR